MSLLNVRSAEPLYIVILRDNQAENILKSWVKTNRIEHATVTGNRMSLHHQHAFDRLLTSWTHSWDQLTVWDTWNRRHIYL
jgi:hypothetical protein